MILPNPRNSILRVLSIFDYYPKMKFFPKNLTLSIFCLLGHSNVMWNFRKIL